MRQMSTAFICSQLIHIMRAIQLNRKVNEFIDEADIFINQTFKGAKAIATRLEKVGCFNRVYVIDPSKRGMIGKMMWGYSKTAAELHRNKYDTVVCFNLESAIATVLFNLNKNKAGFSYHCIEDGPGLYNISIPRRYPRMHPYSILGLDKPFYHIDKWWFSKPEMMEIPFDGQAKCTLPIFDIYDQEFTAIINEVFDYCPKSLPDDTDILIMEEAFYTDNTLTETINDLEIYDIIRKIFAHKRIVVKLHPRTRHNRFIPDFHVMDRQDIPWEVYLLNLLRERKKVPIQIGIRCNTLQCDWLAFGVEGKKISLAPMFSENVKPNGLGICDVSRQTIEQLCWIRSNYKNPGQFVIASNLQEVLSALHQWLD